MTFVRSRNISLKYQRFTTLGSKDIGIRKSEFVAKSQFLRPLFKFDFKILMKHSLETETFLVFKDVKMKRMQQYMIQSNSC